MACALVEFFIAYLLRLNKSPQSFKSKNGELYALKSLKVSVMKANVREDEIIEDDIDMEHIETIYGEGEAIDLNMAERHGGRFR